MRNRILCIQKSLTALLHIEDSDLSIRLMPSSTEYSPLYPGQCYLIIISLLLCQSECCASYDYLNKVASCFLEFSLVADMFCKLVEGLIDLRSVSNVSYTSCMLFGQVLTAVSP